MRSAGSVSEATFPSTPNALNRPIDSLNAAGYPISTTSRAKSRMTQKNCRSRTRSTCTTRANVSLKWSWSISRRFSSPTALPVSAKGLRLVDRLEDGILGEGHPPLRASANDQAQRIKTEIAFFRTVKVALTKTTGRGDSGRDERLDLAIRQLVDQAIAPEGVVDIFAAAGLDKPDISGLAILSDGFLAEIQGMPQRNLALELLRKLLNDEITASSRTNAVQSRRFSEKLEESINRYHNRALETAQIIEALIDLAREMRDANNRGDRLGLTTDELAFYDALGANASAQEVLGDDQLRVIAREVADTVRRTTRIDWQYREQARADLRRLVRRALRRHGYPPDQQESATHLVLEQAELLAADATDPAPSYRG